jgi:hypothetical protein
MCLLAMDVWGWSDQTLDHDTRILCKFGRVRQTGRPSQQTRPFRKLVLTYILIYCNPLVYNLLTRFEHEQSSITY